MSPRAADMLPAGPFVSYARRHWHLLEELPSVQRLVLRGEANGRVNCYAADRACIGMGVHPSEVYGEQWWEAPR